jgi:hypothetical protein
VGVQRHDALQKGTITPDTAATANGTAHERTAEEGHLWHQAFVHGHAKLPMTACRRG